MHKSILAAALLAGAPALLQAAEPPAPSTAPDTNALLNQVIQIASAGQTPETQADVRNFVQENKGSLSAILTEAVNYLSHLQTQAAARSEDDVTAPADSAPAAPAAEQASISTATQAGGMQPSAPIEPASVQPSSGLRTSSMQPSSGLQTGHLAGYPSLPDVDPTSSVKNLTLVQIDYAQKVNAENLARKHSLMAQSAVMGN